MRINAGRIILAVAVVLAVALATGFVWVHFIR